MKVTFYCKGVYHSHDNAEMDNVAHYVDGVLYECPLCHNKVLVVAKWEKFQGKEVPA